MVKTDPGSDPNAVNVSVAFAAVVFDVDSCTIDDVIVRMSRGDDDKWSGQALIVPSSAKRQFRLSFRAPSQTDFALTVKARGTKLLDMSDTSDKAQFTIEKELVVPPAAD